MDIQRNDAIDGAQCIIIVGTLLLTKNMERIAQDAQALPKVLYLNFELIMLHKVLVVNNQMPFW